MCSEMASSRLLAAASGGRQGGVAAASLLMRGVWRPSSNVPVVRHLSSGLKNSGTANPICGLKAAAVTAGQKVCGLGQGGDGREAGRKKAHGIESIHLRLLDLTRTYVPLARYSYTHPERTARMDKKAAMAWRRD